LIKIIKSSVAKQDLTHIWYYSYKNFGEKQADKYVSLLENKINSLQNSPMLGVDCSYIRKKYRKLQIEHHVAFYYINKSEIIITRILHEKMNYKKHLQPPPPK